MAKRKKIYQLPMKTLKPGDKGLAVFQLQDTLDHILKNRGKNRLTFKEPARYGVSTSTAVYAFCDMYGIRATFDFDISTRNKLREVLHAD